MNKQETVGLYLKDVVEGSTDITSLCVLCEKHKGSGYTAIRNGARRKIDLCLENREQPAHIKINGVGFVSCKYFIDIKEVFMGA